MSLNVSPAQLGVLAARFTRLIKSSEMASKRSVRAYVEEDDGADDAVARQGKRGSTCEDLVSVGMERQVSASSSLRTSCDGPVRTYQPDSGVVDLGRDMSDILQPQGWTAPRGLVANSADHREACLDIITSRFQSPETKMARPPLNFGVVVPGVYRSSYPTAEAYGFIRILKVKTIVTLVDKELPEGYRSFMAANNIRHHVFSMRGTKKEAIPVPVMKSILRLVLDRQNHPLLLHCNHGKHRTGCVVAVIRKLSGWTLSDAIDEYKAYAHPKVRECDVEYISRFQLARLSNLFRDPTAVGFRVPNFFRTTFFTIFVLAIWMISGSQMAHTAVPMARTGEDNAE